MADLTLMADDGILALLCWEASPPNEAWCHRALVAAWLHDELGREVCEFGALGSKMHSSLIQEMPLPAGSQRA